MNRQFNHHDDGKEDACWDRTATYVTKDNMMVATPSSELLPTCSSSLLPQSSPIFSSPNFELPSSKLLTSSTSLPSSVKKSPPLNSTKIIFSDEDYDLNNYQQDSSGEKPKKSTINAIANLASEEARVNTKDNCEYLEEKSCVDKKSSDKTLTADVKLQNNTDMNQHVSNIVNSYPLISTSYELEHCVVKDNDEQDIRLSEHSSLLTHENYPLESIKNDLHEREKCIEKCTIDAIISTRDNAIFCSSDVSPQHTVASIGGRKRASVAVIYSEDTSTLKCSSVIEAKIISNQKLNSEINTQLTED